MSEIDLQIPSAFDPFAEANAEDSSAGSKEYVHIRIQQRNGRKSLTTVQGLKKEFSYNKILKDLKKEFCCNGTVVQDPELGQSQIVLAPVVDRPSLLWSTFAPIPTVVPLLQIRFMF
ncbi:hypothetical protein E3N88_33461 [Mikania micrantha]|uniref:SUI1 domain-containing protein n=1 Tax=Mikania micrantha TaxID=192012 RepID=A0A5N6MBK5_9ASTR|nr:hypothetical protein E3N88_33461 [Mikania micrantha]